MVEARQADWTGNKKSIFVCHGASNHTEEERQEHDYYATEPKAVERLLEKEVFCPHVWECACGQGHISEVLKQHGYRVRSSDLIYRGYTETEVLDFLSVTAADIEMDFPRDIITNPPYKFAKEFVEHALDISLEGTKVAMFLKLTFLEGKARRKMFDKYPPKTVYVSSERLQCAKNGDFDKFKKAGTAVAYAWFVWEKGFNGKPQIEWI